ncbi:nucleotidyl transferase AbiEii/AbiGii toxin family protein [Myxosarcina sp. GI1]|uniref:nucleotidyl transferase AbiEii/AbiGii toxin family protein n=1 Tax=Myxosarcina sp. GI1 TaxID=1541065 RepID=UPI00055D13E8|nr:nucleotidyl transferase AbiEii/AbiGii toxin family protein [Myxosarcina sp. GI1]
MTNRQIENLERVAAILAKVPERFVFTGGGTLVLYVDEIIRNELRPTKDVDCVVEIFSRSEYYRLATMLREAGLSECRQPKAPMCRWEYEELLIDIMPCGVEVLGFSNRWYVEALQNSNIYVLPSGRRIYIFSPLYLLASKIEAFLGRGEGFYFSKDIEDIIVLLDGCEVLIREVEEAEGEIKTFLQQWFKENQSSLEDAVASFLPSSSVSREERTVEMIKKLAISE